MVGPLAGGAQPQRSIFEQPERGLGPIAEIDRLVLARQRQAGIPPAAVCSDAVFVRRAYLDVIGVLPTAEEARQFIEDRSLTKRRALIDRLLAREEFADYWAMKWAEVLRVKSEFPVNLWPNAAQAYHRWIWQSVKENKPLDRFARELLTASGSNFRVGEVNFYRVVQDRDPKSLAQAVALGLMCERTERWPAEQLEGMAAFFSRVGYKSTAEWKEEIVYVNPARVADGPKVGQLPDGTIVALPADRDPREHFADWLVNDRRFAQSMANRAWYWLMGRGIVHEPDDFAAANPPSNPELLEYLGRQLVASGYDFKQLLRLILNSQTYQRSSIVRGDPPPAELFAVYPLRRLDAEVLIDALCQITGTTERYSSAIPEPFTFLPEGHRSVALPDASISSPFLELFGRPTRDTGLASERDNRITTSQRLHLLNSSHVQRKLEQWPRLRAIAQPNRPAQPMVTELYLTILSRFPTEQELQIAAEHARSGNASPREAAVDLAWALINSPEFLYRH